MKNIILVILGIFLFQSVTANGQDEAIISAGQLYNLGNQAYNEEAFDDAIYYYEKAMLLDPGSKDIATNLQLANEQLSTDIIEIEPFFLASWWNGLSGMFLPGGWKIVSIICLIGLLSLVFFYFFKERPSDKNHFYAILGIGLLLFLVTIFAGQTRTNQIYNSPYVIVFGGNQALYQAPDPISEEVKDITGGNKLRILDEFEGWYKVAAMDSEQGWIKKEKVRAISMMNPE